MRPKLPMEEPKTVPWGIRLSTTDFSKLQAGFEGTSQDDKWRFRASEPSADGTTSITITRVGTRRDFYILHIKAVNDMHVVEEFTWDHNMLNTEIPEERAKREAVELCRCILGCEIEALPEVETGDCWRYPGQHEARAAGQGV